MNLVKNLFAAVRSKLRILPLIAVMFFAHNAVAVPTILINDVYQYYPWNTKIEISYMVSDIVVGQSYRPQFTLTTQGGETKTIYDTSVVTANGSYKLIVDISKYFPGVIEKNVLVKACLLETSVGGVRPPDATGKASDAMGDVLIIDVSDGPTAATYPVEYYNNVDMGWFNCSAYKTSKIILRKIPAGSYTIGENDIEGNTRRTVTTQGYYIGIFPVTLRQYLNVMGGSSKNYTGDEKNYPSNPEDERPVRNVDCFGIRSWWIESPADWMLDDENASAYKDGFLPRLCAKAKFNGQTVIGFDLPTEIQWEIACRAGSTTPYFWGDYETGTDGFSWWISNATMSHAVGQKLPNQWGIYDFSGNVSELTRDKCDTTGNPQNKRLNPNTGTNADIPMTDATQSHVIRGGSYLESPWSSSSRATTPCEPNGKVGFRLFKALP